MKTIRNTPTAFRFDPTVKDALSFIADRDGRSMANMIEWLIKQHCEREGLGWPPTAAVETAESPTKAHKVADKTSSAKKR